MRFLPDPALVQRRAWTLVFLPVFLAGSALAQSTREYTLSGDRVAIYNLIGKAEIVRGTGPDVVVQVTLGGEDAGELKMETGMIDERQTLRIIYPGKRFVYPEMGRGSSTQMSVRDDGTFGNGWGGWSGRQVRISGGGSGLEAYADLVVRVPDSHALALKIGVGEVHASDVNADLNLDTSSSTVTADRIKGSLDIDVGSGDVAVTDLTGPLNVDTGSGDVDLTDIRGDRLNVDTGSGGVRGTGINAPSVDIDTGSGDINLYKVTARALNLDTGSGSVDVGLTSDVEDLMVDTGSGDVGVEVPATLGAEIYVETGSGDIDIDVPHESFRDKRSEFRGKIGDGNGRIDIETGSGSVLVAAVK